MVQLRKASKSDAQAIRALIYRVQINPMSLDWWRFVVAVDDHDRLVGCGQIKPHGDGTRELASIAVQPEWQGQGIGTQIITRLLVDSPLPLYLTCMARMEPYYTRFGFTALHSEEMPPYFHRLYRATTLFRWMMPSGWNMRVMRKNE